MPHNKFVPNCTTSYLGGLDFSQNKNQSKLMQLVKSRNPDQAAIKQELLNPTPMPRTRRPQQPVQQPPQQPITLPHRHPVQKPVQVQQVSKDQEDAMNKLKDELKLLKTEISKLKANKDRVDECLDKYREEIQVLNNKFSQTRHELGRCTDVIGFIKEKLDDTSSNETQNDNNPFSVEAREQKKQQIIAERKRAIENKFDNSLFNTDPKISKQTSPLSKPPLIASSLDFIESNVNDPYFQEDEKEEEKRTETDESEADTDDKDKYENLVGHEHNKEPEPEPEQEEPELEQDEEEDEEDEEKQENEQDLLMLTDGTAVQSLKEVNHSLLARLTKNELISVCEYFNIEYDRKDKKQKIVKVILTKRREM